MNRPRLSRLLNPALEFPARRPVATLAAFGVLLLAAVLGMTRLRPDTSLEAMFARDDAAADALTRVLHRFGAVEELLVLVTVPDGPDAPAGPQPETLVSFARRFEQAITSAPGSAALVDAVLYRPDEDTRRFVEQVLVPAGIFYLDDAAFAAARQRLTPEGMREQLRRNEALLAQPGPAAAAAAKVLTRDPLRLNEFLKPKLAAMGGSSFAAFGEQDALLAPDGRAMLIRVIGAKPPSDMEFCKALVAAATRAAESSNADQLDVSFGGAYAIATHTERSLRADSTESVSGALLGLVVLFALVYRRPVRLLLLAVGPLALGTVLGFGTYAFFSPSATILSAAVGAMMVGMGIDYSVHYLTHYEKRRGAGLGAVEAAGDTSRALFAALFAAWITSVMGFAVVGRSEISALGDFALLGSLGLAGVFVASLTVIPALLVLTDRRRGSDPRTGTRTRLRFSVDPLLAWVARHARACIAFSLVVLVGALAVGLLMPGPILSLEPDLTVMHPRPNPALETQAEIARRFGSVPGSLVVHLRADTPAQLVTLAHRVDERLRAPAVREAGVSGSIGLASVLPDPATAERRLAEHSPAEADRIVAEFRAAVADSAFDPAAFEPYARFLRQLLSRRDVPGLPELLKYRRLAQLMLPSASLTPGGPTSTEAITLVSLDRSIDERDLRAATVNAVRGALAGLPGATVTGLPVLAHDAEARVAREVPRVFGLALALVLVYVLVHFRSPRDALLSLTSAAFGMVVLLAVMRLAGVRLNMVNLIALPLLIGMTIDYGIFLVSLARIGREHGAGGMLEHLGSSSQAVIVCAATTLLGFGSLALTSVPAVRSLGIVVVVGMAAALAGALFLLAPLLLVSSRGSLSDRGTSEPVGVDTQLDAEVPRRHASSG